MKHYYLKALTLLTCLLFGITAHAHSFEAKNNDGVTIYYDITSSTDKTVSVTFRGSYSSSYSDEYTGSIVIPETVTYNGTTYSVTSIGGSAFIGCSGLTSITIPNSVTSIGSYAFYNCDGLNSITIPNSVTSIGSYTFYDCSGLNSITIPNSVTSIGSSAFYNCDGLTSVTIPNSVTSIENYAFEGCTGLTTIKVETGNSKYDSRNNCNAIIETESNALITGCKNTVIPNSVTSIGDSALKGCSGLTSITIPNSVTSIGNSAFYNCIALKELRIEDGETTLSLGYNSYSSSGIGEGLFYDCPLETLYLGRNIKYTDYKASNTYLVYPERYGYSAFYNIKKLKTVTIGNSVASIGSYAFYNCDGLTSVTIPNSVTSIGESAFEGCSALTGVTIPNSVTSIGDSALKGCSALTSVTIPNSVTSIGDSAFSGCSGLTSVIFNAENCKKMGSSNYPVFNNCTKLSSVTIGENVKNIPHYAFRGCSGLTSVNISDLEAWCKIDFGNYDANPLYYAKKLYLNGELLTGLIIPDSITEIKKYAFSGCSGLTSVTIPNSVTSIGYYAFESCSGLTNITIPNSVTSIGSDALFGCTGLCSIKRNATATTQTKLNFDITNNTEYEFYIELNYKTYGSEDKTIEIPELAPYKEYSLDYGLRINGRYCDISRGSEYYTKSLNQKLETENGDFYIKAKGSYTEGDATILGTMLSFQEEPTEYDNLNEKTFSNLDPNTNYTVYYSVNTKEGGVYSASKTFTTGALTWNDEESQATSTTSARLMTATNCDAIEGTGFEWRRYGAPENLKPNAVACPVVDGMLIGSLRNLNSEAYYEFRPYYTSSSGNTHYGEWTALFTGDANVYFEPEVRTYEDVVVTTNNVTLKGYALAGTDDIISQGFEYWKSAVQPASLTASGATMKVEATGITMSTTIGDLEYGTTYCYRAYATTSKGTIYGDTVEFTTEKDLSGVESVIAEEDETIEYYNLQGVRVVNPERGLYIKRQGGKTTKVVL